DGSFKGKQAISRAEFATIIARFEDLTLDKPNPFTDVSDSHWAKDSIVSVANKGWVSGYPDGSFQPEKKITRSEVVSIVNRILERNGDKEYIQGQQQQLMVFTDVHGALWAYYDICEATNGHTYKKNDGSPEVWISVE
ncbi:S-layer homology domain-containing protein, partial [Clostridium cadaveris]|uniref:S-layer homology domain-containing protein n=1 Tax=Clostridium cadaveris TaxID=1529 RepID=UPI0015B5EC13